MVTVELTPDELAMVVRALKLDASRWAEDWARAYKLTESSKDRLWQRVAVRYDLILKLEALTGPKDT